MDRQGRWGSPMGYASAYSSLPPSQYIFGPHTHVHMNYNIFNIFNERIFEQYL